MKKLKSTKITKQITGGIDHGPALDLDGGVLISDMSPADIHPEVGVLSIDEFAVWAGICRSKVYMEIAAERLVADKVGRRTIIWKSEAERWRADLPKFVVRRPQPIPAP